MKNTKKPVHQFKELNSLPVNRLPDTIYYVLKNDTGTIEAYITDKNSNPYLLFDTGIILNGVASVTGTGVTGTAINPKVSIVTFISNQLGNQVHLSTEDGKLQVNPITSPDGSLEVTNTSTELQIELSSLIASKIDSALQSGDNISELLNDVGYITITDLPNTKIEFNNSLTDGDFLFVGDISQYTNEQAQDAVGSILTDTTTVDLIYDDTLNIIKADVKLNSITSNELANNINISEFINDSSYETTSQLNIRDTNNRNRSNHTGVQLSSTISDFTTASRVASVADTIIDGINTIAPSQNAVYDALILKENKSEKGTPNGYTPLDINAKIPLIYINDSLLGNVNYQGLYNATTNVPDLTTVELKGHYYVCSNIAQATRFGLVLNTGDWVISNGTIWEKVDNTDAVSTVFGRTGNILAVNGDYNTGLVTEVANKNYQTDNQKLFNDATSSIQTQLNTKLDKNTSITGATKTKITYDSKGLVLNGVDAITNDINDTVDKRYQTDNQKLFNDATSSIQTQLNGKQPLLTNPITGTGTLNRISKWGSANIQIDSNISDTGTAIVLGVTGASNTAQINGITTIKGTTASDSPTLGAELLTSDTPTTNWSGTSWALGYTHTVGSVIPMTSSISVVAGSAYSVTLTVSGSTAGTYNVTLGGTSSTSNTTGNQTRTFGYTTIDTSGLIVTPSTDFDGTIILSIKLVTATTPILSLQSSSGVKNIEIRYSNPSSGSIFIGNNVGRYSIIAQNNNFNNTVVGDNAFNKSSNSRGVTGFGQGVLSSLTTGASSSVFGYVAGSSLQTTGGIDIFGTQAVSNLIGGSNIASFGAQSLLNLTTANSSNNTSAFGYQAGAYLNDKSTPLTSAANSLFLGYRTSALGNGQTNQVVIGHDAQGLGSNTTVLGNSSTIQTHTYGVNTFGSNTTKSGLASNIDSNGTSATLSNTYLSTIATTGSISGSVLRIGGTLTASGGGAKTISSSYIAPSFVAGNDGDVLIGMDVNPSFSVGSFTGVSSLPFRARIDANGVLTYNNNSGLSGYHSFEILNTGSSGSGFASLQASISSTKTNFLQFYKASEVISNFGVVRGGWAGNVSQGSNGMFFGTINNNAPVIIGSNNIPIIKLLSTGNMLLQNGGTFTDNLTDRLQVSGSAISTAWKTSGGTANKIVLGTGDLKLVSDFVLSSNLNNNFSTPDGTGTKVATYDATEALTLDVMKVFSRTGLADTDDETFYASALSSTTLRISAIKRIIFTANLYTAPFNIPDVIKSNIPQADFTLSSLGLPDVTGTYIRFFGYDKNANIQISTTPFIGVSTVCQLGYIKFSRTAPGVLSFSAEGVVNFPEIAGYSRLERDTTKLISSTSITPKTAGQFTLNAGQMVGFSAGWVNAVTTQPNPNTKIVSAQSTAIFRVYNPTTFNASSLPATIDVINSNIAFNRTTQLTYTVAQNNAIVYKVVMNRSGELIFLQPESATTAGSAVGDGVFTAGSQAVAFQNAKDGVLTCQYDTSYLHPDTYTTLGFWVITATNSGIPNLTDATQCVFLPQSSNGGITSTALAGELRVPVNDANFTVTGANNQLIAYTNITANRTLTLPSANIINQRLWIVDESNMASSTRMIIVVPGAGDTIGGGLNTVINFPGGTGYLESNGLGKWTIISTTAIQLSAGVISTPSVVDNGNGTITVGSGVYSLFSNIDGSGRPKAFAVTGGVFTFTDNSTNYIYAEYDTTLGTVSLKITTSDTLVNDTTQVNVISGYRQGFVLFLRNYGALGLSLANKTNRSLYKTQRIRVEPGAILLGETAGRVITITAGTAWIASAETPLTAINSTANTCYHVIQTAPGVWTSTTVVTAYNNSQYNTSAGLQTLSNNRYAVNFVYRRVGTSNAMAIVLGTGDYILGDAQIATPPANLPSFISQMYLVGRIIVQKSAVTATQIDNSNAISFSQAGVTDHNALNNLQLAGTGVTYGHVTDQSQLLYGDKTFLGFTGFFGVVASTPALGTPAIKVSNGYNSDGINSENSAGGNAIVANTITGGGFNYVGQNNAVNTFTVNKTGNIAGASIALSGLTQNFIPKAGTGGLLGNSSIFDNGSAGIGIGTTTPFNNASYRALSLAGINCLIDFTNSGTIALQIVSDVTNTYLNESRNLPLNFLTQGLNRMSILGNGNVGIGTATAGRKLEVAGNARFTDAGSNSGLAIPFEFASTAGFSGWNFAVTNNNETGVLLGRRLNIAAIGTLDRTALSINPDGGNILMGKTDDNGTKLQVNGGIDLKDESQIIADRTFYFGSRTANNFGVGMYFNNNISSLIFYNGNQGNSILVLDRTGGTNGSVKIPSLGDTGLRTVLADATGTLSAPVSDIFLKENIQPIEYGLKDIMKMNPVSYNFKEKDKYGDGKYLGNIAQEMEKVIPEVVFTDTNTGKMGIEYSHMHAVYIKSIQELKEINDKLTLRIEQLENK